MEDSKSIIVELKEKDNVTRCSHWCQHQEADIIIWKTTKRKVVEFGIKNSNQFNLRKIQMWKYQKQWIYGRPQITSKIFHYTQNLWSSVNYVHYLWKTHRPWVVYP